MSRTSGAAGSGARSEARHCGRSALAALQAAFQDGLHVLVFCRLFSILDTLRLALRFVRGGAAKFTALQGGVGLDGRW